MNTNPIAWNKFHMGQVSDEFSMCNACPILNYFKHNRYYAVGIDNQLLIQDQDKLIGIDTVQAVMMHNDAEFFELMCPIVKEFISNKKF